MKFIICLILFMQAPVLGYAVNIENLSPSHEAVFELLPREYETFVYEVDKLFHKIKYKRVSRSADLELILQRKVLFLLYTKDGKDDVRGTLMTIDDIKKPGKIRIQLYADALKSQESKVKLVEQLTELLKKYNADLHLFVAMPDR